MLVFGRASAPVQKARRMAYWMRRYANNNPFAAPPEIAQLPRVTVARLLLQRMAGAAATVSGKTACHCLAICAD
jgi:hypothetical protein